MSSRPSKKVIASPSKKDGVEAVNGVSKRSGREKKTKDEQKTPTLPQNGENKEGDDGIAFEVAEAPPKTKKRRRSDSKEGKKKESKSARSSWKALAQELETAFRNLKITGESPGETENVRLEILDKMSKLEKTSCEKDDEYNEEMEKAMKRIAELEQGQNKKCLEWIDKYQTELRKCTEYQKKATEAAKEMEKMRTELVKTKSALSRQAIKTKLHAVIEDGRFLKENRQLKEQLEELKSINAALSTTPSAIFREQLVAAQKRIKELEDTIQSMKKTGTEVTAETTNNVADVAAADDNDQTASFDAPIEVGYREEQRAKAGAVFDGQAGFVDADYTEVDYREEQRAKTGVVFDEKFKWQKNPDAQKERRKNTSVNNDKFRWQNRFSSGALANQNDANKEGGTISTERASNDVSDDRVPFGPVPPPHIQIPPYFSLLIPAHSSFPVDYITHIDHL